MYHGCRESLFFASLPHEREVTHGNKWCDKARWSSLPHWPLTSCGPCPGFALLGPLRGPMACLIALKKKNQLQLQFLNRSLKVRCERQIFGGMHICLTTKSSGSTAFCGALHVFSRHSSFWQQWKGDGWSEVHPSFSHCFSLGEQRAAIGRSRRKAAFTL